MNNNNNDLIDNDVVNPLHLGLLLLMTFFLFLIIGTGAVLVGGESLGLLVEIFIIVPAGFYVWRLRMPFFKTFRLHPISLRLVGISVLIALSSLIVFDEMDRLVNMVFPMPAWIEEAIRTAVQIESLADAVLLIGMAVLVAGVAEEMLFRGMVQRSIETYRDPAMGIVLSSVIFALAHFNPWTAMQITFMGLLLGYLAWKSGSILPAIILHAINNLASLMMMNTSPGAMEGYLMGRHVHPLWILVAVAILTISLRAFKIEVEKTHNS
jgi:membrane protease YdiL (CAAX protease family)